MFTPNEAVTTAVESISDKGVKEKLQNFLAMLSSSGRDLGRVKRVVFRSPSSACCKEPQNLRTCQKAPHLAPMSSAQE
jgi:hypothetical protein